MTKEAFAKASALLARDALTQRIILLCDYCEDNKDWSPVDHLQLFLRDVQREIAQAKKARQS